MSLPPFPSVLLHQAKPDELLLPERRVALRQLADPLPRAGRGFPQLRLRLEALGPNPGRPHPTDLTPEDDSPGVRRRSPELSLQGLLLKNLQLVQIYLENKILPFLNLKYEQFRLLLERKKLLYRF